MIIFYVIALNVHWTLEIHFCKKSASLLNLSSVLYYKTSFHWMNVSVASDSLYCFAPVNLLTMTHYFSTCFHLAYSVATSNDHIEWNGGFHPVKSTFNSQITSPHPSYSSCWSPPLYPTLQPLHSSLSQMYLVSFLSRTLALQSPMTRTLIPSFFASLISTHPSGISLNETPPWRFVLTLLLLLP